MRGPRPIQWRSPVSGSPRPLSPGRAPQTEALSPSPGTPRLARPPSPGGPSPAKVNPTAYAPSVGPTCANALRAGAAASPFRPHPRTTSLITPSLLEVSWVPFLPLPSLPQFASPVSTALNFLNLDVVRRHPGASDLRRPRKARLIGSRSEVQAEASALAAGDDEDATRQLDWYDQWYAVAFVRCPLPPSPLRPCARRCRARRIQLLQTRRCRDLKEDAPNAFKVMEQPM